MPAKSKKQQRFMGMVHRYQQGDMDDASAEVRDAADSISPEDAVDFASTDHDGLPDGVGEMRIGNLIGQYNEYGSALQSTPSLRDLAEQLADLVEYAEAAIMNEDDDWFDTHTKKRNVKEMTNYLKEFNKVANEYDMLHQRAGALYDDIGRVLERYFDITDRKIPDGYNTGDGEYMSVDNPEHPVGASHMSQMARENASVEEDADVVDPKEDELRHRLLRLARHKLKGEQLVVFDTLDPVRQVQVAWKIARG